jgi:hypothetical protein
MEKPTYTRTNLSSARVIMTIIYVPVGELLCQTVMERIPVLECPLPGVYGLMWLRPITPDIK